jgi:hypothetical protein
MRYAAALLALILCLSVTTDVGRTAANRRGYGMAYHVIPGRFLFNDLMASWWTAPQGYVSGDLILKSGVEASGAVSVASFDTVTGLTDRYTFATNEQDDHNAAALVVATGKPTVAIRARHGEDNVIRVYRSATNGGIDFGANNNLDFGNLTTYVQAWQRPSTDEIHAFTRVVSSGFSRLWRSVYSTDWGVTWSSPRTVFDFGASQQGYIITVPTQADGDVLRVALTGHPTLSTVHDIYVCLIDMGTGDITETDGTVLGNLKDGTNLPLTPTSLEKAVDNPDNGRLFAVGSGPDFQIAYARWSGAGTSPTYRVETLDGTWSADDLGDTGDAFGQAGTANYFGGLEFPYDTDGTTVYRSREDAGTWYIESVVIATNTATELMHSSTILARPHPIIGGELTWLYVRTYADFDDWDGDTLGLQ